MRPSQTIDEIVDAIIHLNGNRVTELALKAVTRVSLPSW